MRKIRRRDFLLGVGSVPLILPYGPNPLDPRQPRNVMVPRDPEDWRQRPYTEQPPASPVHLSGSLVLPSGTNGSVPAAALKNPMGQDMELLEIKFELSGEYDEKINAAFGATIQCELVMGTYKITNAAVPVWNFGRAENIDREQQIDSTDDLAFISYSWRLPRPLFIPAGAVVIPTFSHTGMVQAPINVRVGYSCRTIFTKPKKIYMPYVAKFASKAMSLVVGGTDVSSELDLVNPNEEVFHLQRFTGRVLSVITNGGQNIFDENQPISFPSQYLNLRITDSYGRPVVRNFSPFRSVFGALTRSWEMDNGAELDPEAFYKADLKLTAMPIDTGNYPAITGQAFISMVGWRELETP